MGKAHYINATLHFFLFALALLENNGQSPLLSPQWLDLKPTHFLRDLLTWHLGQCAQGGHSPELIYAVRPCFAVCALLWDAAAVSLLIRIEGTVWLTLITLACFKRTIHGCHLSLSLYRGKSHHIVFPTSAYILNSNTAKKILLTTDCSYDDKSNILLHLHWAFHSQLKSIFSQHFKEKSLLPFAS